MDPLDIVNMALHKFVGIEATSMADTARNPAEAIQAYPFARDYCLRLAMWPSCTRRAALLNWAEQATPWTAEHDYVVGDRCTNDSDKTYECTTAGTSDSSGGPTGTSDSITDGTVVWTYKEASTTANNWCWQPDTAYSAGDLVSWDTGKVYECTTAGTSDSSGGPTGTSDEITDNTVVWRWYGTPPENKTVYTYTYMYPTDCLRLYKIPTIGALKESDQGEQYLREQKWVYCDQDESSAIYVIREEDPTNWDPLLQEAVAAKIAADIAMVCTGKESIRSQLYNEFVTTYATAKSISLNERSEGTPEGTQWVDL